MKRICYYISEHGFGHASRSIAIIRYLKRQSKNKIVFVKTRDPFNFIRNSLENQIRFFPCNNDIGVCHNEFSIQVDRNRTELELNRLIIDWKKKNLQNEINFCKEKKIDLIVTDISAFPLLVADKLRIPSMVISNFNWYKIYEKLNFKREILDFIQECYEKADLALVLPFEDDMSNFRKEIKVGLVSREITEDKLTIYKKLGKIRKVPFIFLSIGKSISSEFLKTFQTDEQRFDYLTSHLSNNKRNVFRIPLNETESQNYIKACDLVITKSGYSTVAEAVKAQIPLLVYKRPISSLKSQFISEDVAISNLIQKFKVGLEINLTDWNDEIIKEMIENQQKIENNYLSLPDRYRRNGCIEIIKYLYEFLS